MSSKEIKFSCLRWFKSFNSLYVLFAKIGVENGFITFLMATFWFVNLSLAEQTRPKAPIPIGFRSEYREVVSNTVPKMFDLTKSCEADMAAEENVCVDVCGWCGCMFGFPTTWNGSCPCVDSFSSVFWMARLCLCPLACRSLVWIFLDVNTDVSRCSGGCVAVAATAAALVVVTAPAKTRRNRRHTYEGKWTLLIRVLSCGPDVDLPRASSTSGSRHTQTARAPQGCSVSILFL